MVLVSAAHSMPAAQSPYNCTHKSPSFGCAYCVCVCFGESLFSHRIHWVLLRIHNGYEVVNDVVMG